jgi:hypothetical protein
MKRRDFPGATPVFDSQYKKVSVMSWVALAFACLLSITTSSAMAENGAALTIPSSTPSGMSAEEVAASLVKLSKPATSMEVIKNAEFVFRHRLLRYDAFYTEPNLERVLGLSEASAKTVATAVWTSKEEMQERARKDCRISETHNVMCEIKSVSFWLDEVVGKRDVTSYWRAGLPASASNQMEFRLQRWNGGPYYCCGHSSSVRLFLMFEVKDRPSFEEASTFLLRQGYRLSAVKPGYVDRNDPNLEWVWMAGLGDDGARQEIRFLINGNGAIRSVDFIEEFN